MVELCEQVVDEGGVAGGSAAPFGAVPDWQNAIRRQVAALQFADMNGDGLLDLVAGCYQSQSFPPYDDWRNFVHFNTGGQLEIEPSWYSADEVHTTDIQIGLLNNDAYPDILAANGGSSHSPSVIYFGTPAGPDANPGWSSTTPISTWAVSAALFDFDHDGDLDIVTTNQSAIQSNPFRPLYLFPNNGGVVQNSPSWQSADTFISNGIDVGDYDNDGWEDIAVAKWVNFESAIYKSDAGTLQTLPIWSTGDDSGGRGAGFADFDDNGWLDLVYGYDPTRLYSNDGVSFTQTWETTAPFSGAQELRVHDFDHDGDEDLAEVYFSTGRCHLYVNNSGVLPVAPSWTYDAPNVGNAVAFGDINGDGCDDLAVAYSGEPSIRVFYNTCLGKCPADINADSTVNVDDLLIVINTWGEAKIGNPSDLNGDGMVDVDDLLIVINAWGPCG